MTKIRRQYAAYDDGGDDQDGRGICEEHRLFDLFFFRASVFFFVGRDLVQKSFQRTGLFAPPSDQVHGKIVEIQ